MPFPPIKSSWSIGDELTSSQMNSLAGSGGDITKALNATGDGYATGGGISGVVDVLTSGTLRLVSNSGSPYAVFSGSSLEIKATGNITLDGYANMTVNGIVNFPCTHVVTQNYQCDSGSHQDFLVLLDNSGIGGGGTTMNVTLPASPTDGRIIIVKMFQSSTNYQLLEGALGQSIDGNNAFSVNSVNWGTVTVMSFGQKWYITSKYSS